MIDRRRFLNLGAGGALAALLGPRAEAQNKPPLRKVKSVIWLWMGGGPSQLDTWDPKPDHPNGGGVKAIETSVPGIRISEFLPVCATQMERLSIVRSVVTNATEHEVAEHLMHAGVFTTCWDSDSALGTVLAYELSNPNSGAPAFVAIDPPRIPEVDVFGKEFLPLILRGPLPELSRAPAPERRALLADLEKEWTATRQQKGASALAEARIRLDRWRDSGWTRAMTLDEEPEELKRAYGGTFGQNCLRARRLAQAGVAVVEVGLYGWDTHENHSARTRNLCASLDAGLGTLLRDLAEKNLLKDTVVLCLGEFGRSPKLDEADGRGHWSKGFSVAMAGGALAGGRVHGDTGPDGTACTKPVSAPDLFMTLMRACGVDGNKSYSRHGRKTKYVSYIAGTSFTPAPIRELF